MFEQLERVALSGGGLYLKNWSKSIRVMPKLSFSTGRVFHSAAEYRVWGESFSGVWGGELAKITFGAY